jgi:hypothetical protein
MSALPKQNRRREKTTDLFMVLGFDMITGSGSIIKSAQDINQNFSTF